MRVLLNYITWIVVNLLNCAVKVKLMLILILTEIQTEQNGENPFFHTSATYHAS